MVTITPHRSKLRFREVSTVSANNVHRNNAKKTIFIKTKHTHV